METTRAVELLKKQIQVALELRTVKRNSPAWSKWLRDTDVVIQKIFGKEASHRHDFSQISYSLMSFSPDTPAHEFQMAYVRGLDEAAHILDSMIEEITTFGLTAETHGTTAATSITQIIDRFHLIARQLRRRYANTPADRRLRLD